MERCRIPTPLALALGLAVLFLAGGCGHIEAIMRANEIERETKVDRVVFTEKMRDTYRMIGYEYYKLAKEAEDGGNEERRKEYSNQAAFYAIVYEDLKKKAAELRADLEDPDQGGDIPPPPRESAAKDGGTGGKP